MTVSRSFRRQIAQEAKDFALLWRHASRYAKAGNPEMAKRIIDSATVSTAAWSPEERAWCLQQVHEAIIRIQARDYERRCEGLPAFEPPEPPIH